MDDIPFAEQARQVTEQLAGLRATIAQITAAAHQVQEALLFHDHPDVTGLDDELDILYRGQM
ncbi:hypothetical protein [Streptomyces sp. NPDC059994]|uniref:hypothetical protein n=1 Tax=Streptomyces sp. NPDC059994 TaxID=3347029 RepID=UPI0036919E4A